MTDKSKGALRQARYRERQAAQRQALKNMAREAVSAWARVRPKKETGLSQTPFAPYAPMPGVAPADAMALDAAPLAWAGDYFADMRMEGLTFLGYPALAEMAQRTEYRVITETIAGDMTRKWILLHSVGEGDDKQDRINAIKAALTRYGVQDAFKSALESDGFFGRGHIYIDLGADDGELVHDIGDGRNAISRAKIKKGALKRIGTVEPVWTYPSQYNSINPLDADFYKPTHWGVMGKSVHRSRLLTLIGREVPNMLKPAYAFGGLPLTQMAIPYVENWLRTRQSVSDLIHSFSVMVFKTMLDGGPMPAGKTQVERFQEFVDMRDNRGLFAIDKETEDFDNISAPIAGLHELQAQSMEQMAFVGRIPIVKMFGDQPSGLNASSDGVLRAYYDTISSLQESDMRRPLKKIIDVIQLSEFGDVDEGIDFKFVELYQLTKKEAAEARKVEADTDQVLIDSGVISPTEARARVASDPDSGYNALDPDETPDPPDDESDELSGVFGQRREDDGQISDHGHFGDYGGGAAGQGGADRPKGLAP